MSPLPEDPRRAPLSGTSAVGPRYTPATAWAAEGARVGLVTCVYCGAAVFIDPRDIRDALATHTEWHRRQEAS